MVSLKITVFWKTFTTVSLCTTIGRDRSLTRGGRKSFELLLYMAFRLPCDTFQTANVQACFCPCCSKCRAMTSGDRLVSVVEDVFFAISMACLVVEGLRWGWEIGRM